MCANYRPVTRLDRLLTFFGVERENETADADAWPGSTVPFIRLKPDSDGLARGEQLAIDDAIWRVVPNFISVQTWARNTFNIRSEEMRRKRTFAPLWQADQRCILPAEWFYEPRYFGTVKEPGKSERWRIYQPGGVPFGIAGLYRMYVSEETGEVTYAVGMLTCNADGHPVMSQFHKPGDEKRMPVILDPADFMNWLAGSKDEAVALCRQWHGPMQALPDPVGRVRRQEPPAAEQVGFDDM